MHCRKECHCLTNSFRELWWQMRRGMLPRFVGHFQTVDVDSPLHGHETFGHAYHPSKLTKTCLFASQNIWDRVIASFFSILGSSDTHKSCLLSVGRGGEYYQNLRPRLNWGTKRIAIPTVTSLPSRFLQRCTVYSLEASCRFFFCSKPNAKNPMWIWLSVAKINPRNHHLNTFYKINKRNIVILCSFISRHR